MNLIPFWKMHKEVRLSCTEAAKNTSIFITLTNGLINKSRVRERFIVIAISLSSFSSFFFLHLSTQLPHISETDRIFFKRREKKVRKWKAVNAKKKTNLVSIPWGCARQFHSHFFLLWAFPVIKINIIFFLLFYTRQSQRDSVGKDES